MTTVFALLRSILRRVAFDGSIGRACADAVVMRSPFVVLSGSRPFRGEAMWAGRLGISPVKAARLLPLLALAPATALAQEPAPASPSASLCVQVDVGGDRAGHLDCAAEVLQRAARIAQSQARAAFEAPTPDVRSSDLTVGVVSQTAVRQRLGSNFGQSVHPQRPARPAPSSRPGGRP